MGKKYNIEAILLVENFPQHRLIRKLQSKTRDGTKNCIREVSYKFAPRYVDR